MYIYIYAHIYIYIYIYIERERERDSGDVESIEMLLGALYIYRWVSRTVEISRYIWLNLDR